MVFPYSGAAASGERDALGWDASGLPAEWQRECERALKGLGFGNVDEIIQ